MVIKRVGPMSVAKVSGVLGVLLGLVIGACISLVMLVAGSAFSAASESSEGAAGGAFFGMLFGAGAIIVLPIFYGVFMFVMGAIYAALYNLAAKWAGGIEIETQ